MRQGKIDWNKPFPLVSISREDLVTAGFPRWQAALSDDEMQQLVTLLLNACVTTFSREALDSAMDTISARHAGVHIIGRVYE